MSNQQLTDYARFIGTLGTGIGAGMMISVPAFAFSSLDSVSNLTKAQRLVRHHSHSPSALLSLLGFAKTFWKKLYTNGATVMPPLLGVSSLTFLLASYMSYSTPFVNARSLFLFGERVCSRTTLFLGIGLLNLGTLVYTVAVMGGLIREMMDASIRPGQSPVRRIEIGD